MRVSTGDGGFRVVDHSGEPKLIERKVETGRRELLQDESCLVGAVRVCVGHREHTGQQCRCKVGCVGRHLFDDRGQLAHGSAHPTDGDELPAELDVRVGYSVVRAELECFGGKVFGLIGVSRDLRAHGTAEQMTPAHQRLVKLIRQQQLVDLEAAVVLVEVSRLGRDQCSPRGRPIEQHGVAEPVGAS